MFFKPLVVVARNPYCFDYFVEGCRHDSGS
jgi:hypothetical protein